MEYRGSDDETPARKIDLMNLSPASNDLASKLSNYKRVNDKVKKSLKGQKSGSFKNNPPVFLDRFAEERSFDEPDRNAKVSRQSVLENS